MKIKDLYNQKNKKELIEILNKENFKRKTISFYKYTKLSNLPIFIFSISIYAASDSSEGNI